MRILRAIASPGTHLGQARLGRPFAAMGRASPLRYLDVRRNLIWDQEPESVAAAHTQHRPDALRENPRPNPQTPKGV